MLISAKLKHLVILALIFLIEADFGWAELLLGHEYLSRESSGWCFCIKCLSCIPKSRWRWICPLSHLSFYACASLAASKCVKIQWERRNEIWEEEYGSKHMLLTAVASVGAVPMRETIRLGPSVCLKDVFCMSLCSHIIQRPFLRSSTWFLLRYLDFWNQTQDQE